MLTIEIPEKISQLVAIAQMGEFPASCWASEIVSDWLYDIVKEVTEEGSGQDPNQCPETLNICKQLGIDHDEFINAGGELYRKEATRLLTSALAPGEDKGAFLQVSSMVVGQLMLSDDRKTFELDWDDIVPGFHPRGEMSAVIGGDLPVPVWQCLMRYYSAHWRDPISEWHFDVHNWIRNHYEKISYSTDQMVPFPATA